MKNFFTHSVVFILFFITSVSSSINASHIMGGDLTYTCTGNNIYNFKLSVFRDCNGIPLGNTATIDFVSPTCGNFSANLNLLASHPVDITPLCASQTSACNGSGTYGVQQYVYVGTLTLNCTANDYVVSWSTCCRNNAITTLNNPGGTSFYVSTDLANNLPSCNSSPDFINTPVPYLCTNQPVNYSHGAFDADNDSLVFSLVSCNQPNGSVSYQFPYSGVNPLGTTNGITIDPSTGNLQFTPSTPQVAVICILIEEYRSGVKIGEVVRDLQFTFINCSNTLPVLSGIDGTADSSGTSGIFETTVCLGHVLDFDVQSFDVNVSQVLDPQSGWQNISLSWNSGISGASFTSTSGNYPTGTFQWTPTASDVGTHLFDVIVQDDACPMNGINVYTFKINVIGTVINLNTPNQHIVCLDTVTLPIPNFTSIPNGSWTGPGIVDSLAGLFSPIIAGLGSHTLVFQYNDPNSFCVILDSINIFVIPSASVVDAGPNDTLCVNAPPLQLSGTPSGGIWTGVGVSSSGLFDPSVTGTGDFFVTYSDSFSNCLAVDYTTITVIPEPSIYAGMDITICENSTVILTQQGIHYPLNGTWSGTGIVDATTGLFDLSGQGGGTGSFEVYYTASQNGCTTTDTLLVNVISSQGIDAGPDFSICEDEFTQLVGVPAGGTWSGYGVDTNDIFNLSASGDTGSFVLYYTYSSGVCVGTDSVTATISSFPVVDAGSNDSLNAFDPLLTLSGYSPTGGVWSGTGIVDTLNGVFDPALADVGTHTLTYTFDDGTCIVSDTKVIHVIFGVNTTELSELSNIKVFPNPVNEVLNIHFEKPLSNDSRVSIKNILGEVIYENLLPPTQQIQIPFDSNWSTGVYLVSLEVSGEIFTFKILKE